MTRRRIVVLIGLIMLTLSGCTSSPTDRVREAWDARQRDDVEAYLSSFTDRSQDLLRGMMKTSERTRGELAYLDPITDLLPSGEILSERVDGELGSVIVASPRGEYEVLFVRERGTWVIDALALNDLWAPLKKATR